MTRAPSTSGPASLRPPAAAAFAWRKAEARRSGVRVRIRRLSGSWSQTAGALIHDLAATDEATGRRVVPPIRMYLAAARWLQRAHDAFSLLALTRVSIEIEPCAPDAAAGLTSGELRRAGAAFVRGARRFEAEFLSLLVADGQGNAEPPTVHIVTLFGAGGGIRPATARWRQAATPWLDGVHSARFNFVLPEMSGHQRARALRAAADRLAREASSSTGADAA